MTTHLVVRTTAGAKLEPFHYSFADADGNPLTLAGYTGRVTWQRHSTGESGDFVVDSVAGDTVAFTVPDAITATPDTVDLQVWVGDGTYRLDGIRWRIIVVDGPGDAPSI